MYILDFPDNKKTLDYYKSRYLTKGDLFRGDEPDKLDCLLRACEDEMIQSCVRSKMIESAEAWSNHFERVSKMTLKTLRESYNGSIIYISGCAWLGTAHASIACLLPCKSAAEYKTVDNGKISFCNKSGHYRPNKFRLAIIVKRLFGLLYVNMLNEKIITREKYQYDISCKKNIGEAVDDEHSSVSCVLTSMNDKFEFEGLEYDDQGHVVNSSQLNALDLLTFLRNKQAEPYTLAQLLKHVKFET